jgi:hypothetical protein
MHKIELDHFSTRWLLRPLGKFLRFWYLNVIGEKNEHFNFATLSDKWSQKGKENQWCK